MSAEHHQLLVFRCLFIYGIGLIGVTIGVVASSYGWNVTVLTWIGIAFLGGLVTFLGIKSWKKGRFMLTGQ